MMATLTSDYGADRSSGNYHNMMPPSGLPYQQPHSHEARYRSSSHSMDAAPRQPPSSNSPRRPRPAQSSSSSSSAAAAAPSSSNRYPAADHQRKEWESAPAGARQQQYHQQLPHSGSGASRFPTPPDPSSPSESASSAQTHSRYGNSPAAYMTSTSQTASEPSSASTTGTVIPISYSRPPTQSIPSPESDSGAPWTQTRGGAPTTSSAPAPVNAAADTPRRQQTIRITDLAHIQRLAHLDMATGNGPGILNDTPLQDMKFEISGMPIGDIIEMVAALLTKITTTNDLQHDALNRNATHQRQAQAQHEGSESHSSPFSTSVLAFHGKNVPAITILSYLSRIHKYCPTTYEVFLSLLVYFDRMTERVNDLVVKDEEARRKRHSRDAAPAHDVDAVMHDDDTAAGGSDSDETDEDLADSDDDDADDDGAAEKDSRGADKAPMTDAAASSATYFVVDSFNIHRLIIAGVTCASKFFSDVFYTNSRYAKVGGLPLAELNHLELQFLLLNDFRLAVPVEDLEAYATMLVEFYAREVVAQRSRPVAGSSSGR